MSVPLKRLAGIGGLPNDRTALSDWAKREGVSTRDERCSGGVRVVVALTSLPKEVQIAYQLSLAEASGLPMGAQDDAAWAAHLAKPPGVQDMAQRRVGVVAHVVRHRGAGLSLPKIMAAWPASLGECPAEMTVQRWLKRVEGVHPANWAPALAPSYATTGRPCTACDPAAWVDFEVRIAASGGNGTGANFKRQHLATKAEADRQGWAFPPYRTVMRHWEKLSVERQRTLEQGAEAAARRLTHYLPRSLEGMRAMEQVEVDFREFKVLCVGEDGTVGCPWVGLAVDRVSSKIVGRTIAMSETAEAYVALTRDMVETHGIPDRLVQDNGAGGNGLRMMGGQVPLVRRKDKGERSPEWAVPGVYEFLGIKVVNHGPRMAWAKLPESLNSVLRHVDNDPIFHRAQRSGPTDAPNPDAVPVPITLFRAMLDRAIADVNANIESRAQGLHKGECRNAAFDRLSEGRVPRWASPLQLRWMRLSWHLHKVTESGQVRHGGGFWGDGTTQRAMLHYAGKSVVIGIEPDNTQAPAMVYEWNDTSRTGRLLLDKLPAVIEARHDDPESKFRAQAEKRRAKAAAQAEEIPDLAEWVAAERAKVMAEMGLPVPERPAPKVTRLTAGGPFAPGKARHQPATLTPKEKTDLYFALKAEGERTASGANR